jgi:hypothetical protein
MDMYGHETMCFRNAAEDRLSRDANKRAEATMLYLPLACDDVSNVAFSRRLRLYSDCERS